MKFFRVLTKVVFFCLLIADVAVFSMIFMLDETVGKSYKISRGGSLEIDSFVPVTVEYNGTLLSQSPVNHGVGEAFEVELKMFGAIPFSTVDVEVVDEMYVAVLGNPFGMKLYTDGVLVIDLTDVDTPGGNYNPAREAGIKKGDYVLSANGMKITCNEDLSEIVAGSGGSAVRLEVLRGNTHIFFTVNPMVSAESGGWKLGLWVRDSSAGIGTLTFYSPATGIICGLGHGICDDDTGSLLTVETGEFVGAQILSVAKGSSGSPGELKGKFTYDTIADIVLNSEIGVFGYLKGNIDISNLTEIALRQEIKNGDAQILCTVSGDKPRLYSCTIKKRNSTYLSKTQNLTVTITDPELLSQTGGIVQGMSGSPILQNGKLVGAVTHVLVDDPTSGYGIFAENMLSDAQSAAEERKEAS